MSTKRTRRRNIVATTIRTALGSLEIASIGLRDGHGIECRAPNRDRYYRWLAVCWRDDGMELNAEMVRLGWALAYRPGNDPFPWLSYEPLEAEVRAAGSGMWRGRFIPPWQWRQQ